MKRWFAKRAVKRFPARFDALMQAGPPKRPPLALYLLSNRADIAVAQGNYLAVQGQYREAALKLARTIARSPSHRGGIVSLGMLASHFLDSETIADCWNLLGGRSALDRRIKAGQEGFYRLQELSIELGLTVDPEGMRPLVDDVIMHTIKQDMIAERRDKTLFYWHIPKCGGTAFNACLARYFYRSGLEKLPSYTTLKLFNLLLAEHGDVLPYLSSGHISHWKMKFPKSVAMHQMVALRDPEARAISAWRQYYANTSQRLNILPQHGEIWSYWPRGDLKEWALRAPELVINRQTSTFSQTTDAAQAGRVLESADLLFDVKASKDAALRVAADFDLDLDLALMATKKNVTDKSINYAPEHLDILRSGLEPDLALIESLGSRILRATPE